MSGSGISWAVCKSAPRSRQITTPAPHHSVFTGRMPFLLHNQQRQSTEGTKCTEIVFVLSPHCGNYDAHLDLLVDWERGYLNAIPLPLNTFRGFNTFRDLDVQQHYILITKTAAISYARHTSLCLGNITIENSDTHTHTHTRLTALCPGLPESKRQ